MHSPHCFPLHLTKIRASLCGPHELSELIPRYFSNFVLYSFPLSHSGFFFSLTHACFLPAQGPGFWSLCLSAPPPCFLTWWRVWANYSVSKQVGLMPAEMHISTCASDEDGKVKVVSCSQEFCSFLSLRNQLWWLSSQGGCFWLLHPRSPVTQHRIVAQKDSSSLWSYSTAGFIVFIIYSLVYCLSPLSRMEAWWEHQCHPSDSQNGS